MSILFMVVVQPPMIKNVKQKKNRNIKTPVLDGAAFSLIFSQINGAWGSCRLFASPVLLLKVFNLHRGF